MSASDNRRSITVGIFVLLGIVILVAGILVLGGQQKRFTRNIHVTAVFSDVGGLKVGNNVWFSGVKIGTVRRMSFTDNSQVEVTMNVEESAHDYIRKNASATISSEGFIGNKIVVIVGGSTRFPPIEDGDRLQAKAALSSDEILETLQENNQNLLKVTNDFKEVVSNIKRGKGVAGAVLTDSTLADNFRGTMANIKQISDNLHQASRRASQATGSLSEYTAKFNTRGTLANDLVTDTTIMNRLRGSTTRLQQAASSAADAGNNLKQASGRLNATDNAIGVLLNDAETSRNLKTLVRNLESGSEKLDVNLEALQHNFLFRGYFRKQAKKEAKGKADKAAKQAGTTPADSVQNQK